MAGMTLAGTALVLASWPGPRRRRRPTRPRGCSAPARHEDQLHLPAASRAALKEDPGEYVPARFRLKRGNGKTYGPLRIGVRLKGFSSFRPLAGKSAFETKRGVRRGPGVPGPRGDDAQQHGPGPDDAARAPGVQGVPRRRPPGVAHGLLFLRIDGDAYGVYLNVESPDEVSAARCSRPPRHLYEAEAVDLTPGAAPQFEADAGDEDDIADLERLIGAVTAWKGLDAVADLEQMTRYWAVEKYIGHWDSYSGRPYPNNYYLHSDAAGRFTMLPWGTDRRGSRGRLRRSGRGHVQPLPGGTACCALYRAAVDDVRKTLGRTDLRGLADRTAKLLSRWRPKDPKQEWSERQVRKWTKRLHRSWPTARTTRPGSRRPRRRKRTVADATIDWTRRDA